MPRPISSMPCRNMEDHLTHEWDADFILYGPYICVGVGPQPDDEPQTVPVTEDAARMVKILDQHLPTILSGLGIVINSTMHLSIDELTEEQLAARAAYSAAHWIAKDISGGRGRPLYDLPSVVDLLESAHKDRARIEELERLLGINKRCGDWPAPCNCDDPETHGGHR